MCPKGHKGAGMFEASLRVINLIRGIINYDKKP